MNTIFIFSDDIFFLRGMHYAITEKTCLDVVYISVNQDIPTQCILPSSVCFVAIENCERMSAVLNLISRHTINVYCIFRVKPGLYHYLFTEHWFLSKQSGIDVFIDKIKSARRKAVSSISHDTLRLTLTDKLVFSLLILGKEVDEISDYLSRPPKTIYSTKRSFLLRNGISEINIASLFFFKRIFECKKNCQSQLGM